MPLTGRIGEQYEIVRPLGSGAMGEVCLAVDRKMFDREVAIKFLSERLTDSEEGRLRFRREVETSARLHHPNIVTIYDWGEHQGRDYYVMEFVDGSDLQVLLRDGVSWDLERRLDVAFQMADALDFAHRAGVIHRDIKPGNVIVVLSDAGPRVKLVDFGIAHVERSNLTQDQSSPGTFTYMSPEQLRGDVLDPLDARRDIFSLGIVLCELFGGRHPFAAKSDALISNRILCDEPDPPSGHGVDLPPELESLILRMVAKEPNERPGTAREVADALREAARQVVARSVRADPTIAAREAASPEAREREEFIAPRMQEINAALDTGNINESLAILSRILRKYPDQADAAVMLDRLVRAAEEGVAYADYRAAVRDAWAALKGGDPEAASASRDRARTIWPDGPEAEALESEIRAAKVEARRRAEAREALRIREEEADARRQRELLERSVDGPRKLLMDARAIRPESLTDIERSIEAFGKAVQALDVVLADAPNHPHARRLRDEGLAEIAALTRCRAEKHEALRIREEEADARRQRELLERSVDGSRKLLKVARAIRPDSLTDMKRAIEAFGKAVRALDLVLAEVPDHPHARTLRDEGLAEIAALTRRRRFRSARIAATVAIPVILIGLGSFAVRGLFQDPRAKELEQILHLPENSVAEVAEKMKRIRAIDDLLSPDDKRKTELAQKRAGLENLNEMYNKVALLEKMRDEASAQSAGPGGGAKLRRDAENVWDLIREYRSKLPDDPNAGLLEKQGRSLLSEIEDRTGVPRSTDAGETR